MSDEKKEVEKFDFFISLKFDPGKPWAEWIAWTLEEFGYWVFFAPWDIGPAENIPHILDEALIHSHHIVLIVSKEYFDSDAGKAEWYSFMHQDYLGKKESIVPIRTAKFKREGFIGPINYVDLVDKTRGEAKDILKKAARRLRRNAPKRLNSGSGFVWERRKYRDKPESEPPFPGDKTESDQTSPSSKVIWNRPNPNPNFTGRRGLLEQLRAKFLGSPTHKIAVEPSQAISGNGGIGKTELAKEYTHIYEAEYDLIAWIHAEEEKKRHQELRDLAVALGLVNEGMEPTEAKKILYEHLNGRSNWLLVFDNVATPAEMKSDLNALKNGHVLMTSRDRHWIGLAESFSLGQFAPDESLDYLKKLLPEEPEEHLRELAARVDHYPLALTHAAAYLDVSELSLEDFFKEYTEREEEFREFDNENSEYSLSIRATTEMSVALVADKCPQAVDVLNVLAFLAAEKIPVDILKAESKEMGLSAKKLQDGIAALSRLSLISYDKKTHDATIHRLVQAVARDKMGEGGCKKFLAAALRLLAEAFPFVGLSDVTKWPDGWRLIPHARVVLDRIEGTADDEVSHWRLCLRAGKFLHAVALYREAEPLLRKAYKIANESPKIEKLDLANTCNELALFLKRAGRHAEAVSLYKQDIRILAKSLGPSHEQIAAPLNNLAGLYDAQGKYDQAEPLYQRALKIMEKALGTEHPNVATTLNNLAGLYDAQGKYDQAEPLYQRDLKITEKALGPDHPDVATTLNNLAGLYYAQGKYGQAEPYYRRCLVILEKVLPPNHPYLMKGSQNFAGCLRKMGKKKEAAEYEAKAEHIRAERKRLGLDGGEGG